LQHELTPKLIFFVNPGTLAKLFQNAASIISSVINFEGRSEVPLLSVETRSMDPLKDQPQTVLDFAAIVGNKFCRYLAKICVVEINNWIGQVNVIEHVV
jgi:hypothetical protein